MAKREEDFTDILRFGGGLNTRASPADIHPSECAGGANFDLSLGDQHFRPRGPFDLVATAPNGEPIKGFATLSKADGTVTALVQAGSVVYSWDGASGFVSVGTGVSGSIRGRLEHYWALDDKVLISDIELGETLWEWDGTTFQEIAFTDETGTPITNAFGAKYLAVVDERVIYANIADRAAGPPSDVFGHLIVGSARSDYAQITVKNRPSSALSEADPWFLIQPDYRPINGLVKAFDSLVTSSALSRGAMHILSGQSARDFHFESLAPNTAAAGDESVVSIGRDVLYGAQGRMESLMATDQYSDVITDDLSLLISDQVEGAKTWTTVHNDRLDRVYFIPDAGGEVWVYHQEMAGGEISPWSVWTTGHTMGFAPTAIMTMIDPVDGLEYTFMGDSSGNIYRLEGWGLGGDGGTSNVVASRVSKIVSLPEDKMTNGIAGWVSYQYGDAFTLELQVDQSGYSTNSTYSELQIPAAPDTDRYGGEAYYGGNFFYNRSVRGRLARQVWGAPGSAVAFQIRTSVSSKVDFAVREIGLQIKGS